MPSGRPVTVSRAEVDEGRLCSVRDHTNFHELRPDEGAVLLENQRRLCAAVSKLGIDDQRIIRQFLDDDIDDADTEAFSRILACLRDSLC